MLKACDRICSSSAKKLRQLCDMLEWANNCGKGIGFMPSAYAGEFYGHIYRAIGEICKLEIGVIFDWGRGPNWGGNATRYDDLMIYCDELLNESDDSARSEYFRA